MPTSTLICPTIAVDKISSSLLTLGKTDDSVPKTSLRSQISALGLHDVLLEAKVYKVLSAAQCLGHVVSLSGDSALSLLNVLQSVMDQTNDVLLLSQCRQCLHKLSERSGVLPSTLFVTDIQRLGDHPVGGGGCADIWLGNHGRTKVALKVLRIVSSLSNLARVQKEFLREALVWRQLKHRNIALFIGVSTDLFPPHMCMVSRWMANGNIMQYLDKNPNRSRIRLLRGIAAGIDYLHSMEPPLIHGDIRGANVLIDDELNPVLSDFGLAIMTDSHTDAFGTGSLMKGSTRWMAPELFVPDLFEGVTDQRTTKTDVYAFACLGLEIYSGRPPFPDSTEPAVMFSILQEHRPELPLQGTPIPSPVWHLIHDCWTHEPHHRPHIKQVLDNLVELDDLDSASSAGSSNSTIGSTSDISERRRSHPEVTFWPNPNSSSAKHPTLLHRSLTKSRMPGPLSKQFSVIFVMAFSPDGRFVASGSSSGIIRIWNAEKNHSRQFTDHGDDISAIAFSASGSYIVSGSRDKSVRVWDAASGASQCFEGHTDTVLAVAFALNEKYVVSGSRDGTSRLWDLTTGASRTFEGHTSSVCAVAFSPDNNHTVSGSSDNTIRIWDINSGDSRLFSGHESAVFSIAWSPDNQHVVSGSFDKTLRVWNVETGACRILTGHTSNIRCLAISPNNKHIVTGSDDKTVRIWDMTSGATVSGPHTAHIEWVYCVAFSYSGKHAISASDDGTVRAWNV